MCAEILSHVVRGRGDIRGIVVHVEEFIVSQYADDTTLLVDEDLECIISIIIRHQVISSYIAAND